MTGASGRALQVQGLLWMKSTPVITLYDLPLPDLHARARRAHDLLHEVKLRVSSSMAPVLLDRASGLQIIHDAFEAVERLVPGLLKQPRSLLARTIRHLALSERGVLREAIDSEREARERLARLLGCVSPEQAEDVLARIEAQESITAELFELARMTERTCFAPRWVPPGSLRAS
jgi:hypothetical protein